MLRNLSKTKKALLVLGLAALAFGGFHLLAGAWKLTALLPLGGTLLPRLQRRPLPAPSLPDPGEVRERDTAADETARSGAVEAGEKAAEDAAGGWTSTPTRKRPRFRLFLGLATAFSVAAQPCPAHAEDALAGLPPCVAATGITEAGAGWGKWYEGPTLYYCPCPARLEEATRLPEGCSAPAPAIAYTVPENAAMWGELTVASDYVGSLRAQLATARTERDQTYADLAASNADLTKALDLNDRLLAAQLEAADTKIGLWYGAGVATGVVLTVLVVWGVK